MCGNKRARSPNKLLQCCGVNLTEAFAADLHLAVREACFPIAGTLLTKQLSKTNFFVPKSLHISFPSSPVGGYIYNRQLPQIKVLLQNTRRPSNGSTAHEANGSCDGKSENR